MGVEIGKDCFLKEKIFYFGISAFVISLFAILLSVLFAYFFVKLIRK